MLVNQFRTHSWEQLSAVVNFNFAEPQVITSRFVSR